jgi:dTDP-glucose 4,6-dehydratase
MKSVLITGGCGFIGSNFVNQFVRANPEVTVVNIDAMYYCANITNVFEDVRCHTNYHFIQGNIQNQDLVRTILDTYQIDTIIHFAAQSHVDNSFNNAIQYTYDNILGTHILLESARLYGGIQKFICISTDEVYGESHVQDEQGKNEMSIMCPTNPYAATKAAAELLARSYYYSYNLPVIVTRGNNVYGPHQYHEKVVPRFITQLLNGEKCTLHGDGSTIRAFIHVDDVVTALQKIIEKGVVGEIYNIGSDEEVEIKQLVHILYGILYDGKQTQHDEWNAHIEYVEDRPFNDKRYYVCDKRLRALGWEPKIDFKEGIRRTVEYYKGSAQSL